MVVKNEITATTKSKKRPEVVKDELTKKEIEHQKDVAKKVTKAKPVNAKDELTSTTKTKTKPNVDKEELIAKVIDYHKRGELRLLTVADLKCFLNAKKAKVGGSKEVLIQRATELIS
uniref:SAP domain-containing protein n=2 Tax=Hordeum vulgare subsp. vulgare TaxID=112509 RepID=A0A8I6YQC5_HORVV